jgi:uncharacterized protein (TIGR02611 family)
MLGRLKKQWKAVVQSPPGQRFRHRYEWRKKQRASPLWKPLYLVVGTALFVLGLVLLPAPGPGFLVVFVGAAMVGQESLWVARLLDSAELRLRACLAWARRLWKRASAAARAAIIAAAALLAAGTGWTAYVVFLE